ncbi:hypothetical protein EV121DRAFT_209538 [Schizophyllum commune]
MADKIAQYRQTAFAVLRRNRHSLAYLLNTKNGIAALFKYIALTKRFAATYGNVAGGEEG